jgi:hypothetical protein
MPFCPRTKDTNTGGAIRRLKVAQDEGIKYLLRRAPHTRIRSTFTTA